jgi:quercetin dioxygenase-like cupin family protein
MSEQASYFGSAVAPEGVRGRFTPIDGQPRITPAPGVHLQPVAGVGLMLSRVTVEPHCEVPAHAHDEEQMGIVIAGSGDFELGGETRPVGPGDTYHAPPGVAHGLRAGADGCVVIDAFSPPRAALLELMGEAADPAGP